MTALHCPECGALCGSTHRFCASCGHPLHKTVAGSNEAMAAAEWGEVKAATILFADIADSTRQIAELSPEQAMQQLQPAISRMVRMVEQHGGTVLRTLGDGIMALFGVPLALEDHASRACLAAMRMQQLFADTVSKGAHAPLALRVGLHTGKVVSDPTEAGDRRGGGAHGLAIHLASRVAAQAEPGQILLTEDTRHLLRSGTLDTQALGHWHLKGILQPVALYALRFKHLTPNAVSPTEVKAVMANSLVGRDNEMAQLVHALGRTRAGQGQLVCITGEAGVGKTRLCTEFARRCETDGLPVVWVQAHPLSHALPLQPARDLLGLLCFGYRPGGMPAEQARERIKAALAHAGHTDAADLTLLHELMGVADEGAETAPTPRPRRETRQARLLAIVADLVRSDAAILRLLVLEDLQWLDAGSWPILHVVAEALAGTHTMLLANQRHSLEFPWSSLEHAAHLPLDLLSRHDLRTIVSQRLKTLVSTATPLPGKVSTWIDRVVERSQGNPFFAEELTRYLTRADGNPQRWQAELPDSIDSLIAARIDVLPETDKRVVQACAVIGKDVDASVLVRVLRLPVGRLAPALRRLQALGLLTREPSTFTALGSDLRFAHPLMQEVAYGAQLQTRRSVVHARVAEVMERRYSRGARGGELAALMAHHREHAGDLPAATRHAVRAAQWLRSGDPSHAIASWRKVLQLAAQAPESRETRALSALAAGRIVFLGWRGGITTQEVGELVAQALDLAGQADPRLPQLLHFAHARMRQATGGSADDYVKAVQAALAMPEPPNTPGRRALMHVVLCQAYSWAGRLRDALVSARIAAAEGDKVSDFDREFVGYSVSQWAKSLQVRALLRMGRAAEAQTCLRELQFMSVREPDVVLQSMVKNLALELNCAIGRASRVEGLAQLSAHTATHHNDYVRITSAYFLAQVAIARHQYAHAGSLLRDGLAYLREHRVAVDFEADLLVLWAETLAARRNWTAAGQVAQEAAGFATLRANRICECRAALVLARSALGSGGTQRHLDEAERWLSRATELLAFTGADYWRPMWRAVSARWRRSLLAKC